MSQKRVGILAIGTELTQGQITNRNAAWISGRLAKMGVRTSGHWTVPDDRPLILDCLELATRVSDLIFVTGGLGPTTDDFTRDVVAEWNKLPLLWDESSWLHIQERLGSRGIAASAVQRQQCFFPEGSQVLLNTQGTANGFRFEAKGKIWVVLPGPPREIEAIWRDHLEAWLPSQFPDLDPWITRIWETMGQGESTIAEKVEEALQGCGYEKGYRVHVPFVEVKLSFPRSQEDEALKWIAAVEKAIAPFTVLRDGDEGAELLAQELSRFPKIRLQDAVSEGYLWHRLTGPSRDLWKKHALEWSNRIEPREDGLILKLEPWGPRQARASIERGGIRRSEILTSPYKALLMRERETQVFAELALLFWARELRQM